MAIIGVVDRLTEAGVRGWVHDDSKPLERQRVTATLSGNPIGSAIAHEFRLDLKTQGIGDGEHAFSIIFDRSINETDIPNISLVASTPDGRDHKTLILPKKLSVVTADDVVTADERLRRQVRRLLKYSSPYAEVSPLPPPSVIASDLTRHLDLLQTGEISYYLSIGQLTIDDVIPALARDVFQIPDSQAREGYAPGRDLAYWMSGYAHYKILEKTAEEYGLSGGRYFDFGGSSGRVLRHFAIQSDAWDVWTCDFKPASIEFINTYFPRNVKAFLNNANPSLPLPDGYFDFITALSVFTHIDEAESSWLLELRRVLRIGGIACITTLNDATWPVMDEVLRGTITTYRPDLADATSLPDGKTVISFREDDPYNCNVLHSDNYIRSRWGRFFDICDIRPLTFNSQALIVCRRID